MIIPIRHDQSEVRRWPWVSGAIMLACLVSFLATDVSTFEALPTQEDYLQDAADFWREHAYLEARPEIVEIVAYDVRPNERKQYLEMLKDFGNPLWHELSDEYLEEEQAELDRLTAIGLGEATPPELEALGQVHPYRAWGYVPSRGFDLGLVTSIFMHAGWLHLLGNLFMFWLAGPAIEDRLGRPGFAVFFLAAGAFSAGFYGLLSQDPDMPLVGASGAIAGAMGAFLLRFWQSEIKFAYFFMFGFRPFWGTFQAKAWFMLPLWLGNEIMQAWWARSSGFSSGVAYEAHIGGFLFGAAALAVIRYAKVEERYLDPRLESKVTHFVSHPAVSEAADLRATGDLDGAWERLEVARRESPEDEDVAFAYWVTAVARERPAEARDAMVLCIEADVARGELDVAARNWCELTHVLPDALCDSPLIVKLLPTLQALEDGQFLIRALRHLVDPDNRTTTPAIALRVLEIAKEADPSSALGAARRALESESLHEAKQAKLQSLIDELAASGVVVAESVAETARAAAAAEAERHEQKNDRSIEIDLDEDPLEPIPEAPRRETPPPLPTAPESVGLDISESTLDEIDLDEYDLSEYADEDDGVAMEMGAPDECVTMLATRFSDLKIVEARPLALEGAELRIGLPGDKSKRLRLGDVGGVSAAIVGDLGAKPVLVIDLVLNWRSLAEDLGRVVRMRSDRFDPRSLSTEASDSPESRDPRAALCDFLERLLRGGGSEAIPSQAEVCGPEWRRFDTLAAYEREWLGVDR